MDGDVQRLAAAGVQGGGQALPHLDRIQASFGEHDVGGVRAHVGGESAHSASAIGAEAYATGSDVAFQANPDLHTAAHEAAHVVQQRAGVQLKGGVGEDGDTYEQHADAVADKVVQGESAQQLLAPFAANSAAATQGATSQGATQRRSAAEKEGPVVGAAAEQTLATLAPRIGHSFDGVAVHAGAAGDARAQSHGAKAVTEGSDIYLSKTVDPASPEGHRVMAHEMAHVVQQTGAATEARTYRTDGDAFEREAHQVGEVVAAGGSASPVLRTGQKIAQGYDSFEHQSMGTDVHSVLNPLVDDDEQQQCRVGDDPLALGADAPRSPQSRMPMLGGLLPSDVAEQREHESKGHGASQSPGLGKVANVDTHGRVPVPQLAKLLKDDPFVNERARSLTLSLRNFKMQQDMAGPYLGIETDASTGEAIRYDVPVAPGDMTALNGDLYASMENMRKAPVSEFVQLQSILDREAKWERDIAAGRASWKDEPNFSSEWEAATSWRSKPVYGAGKDLGPEAAATGGDTNSYVGLALHNQAHFGEETGSKQKLEVQVQAGNLEAIAAGPRGNYAAGNERAWMSGHARALLLARESYALKTASAPASITSPMEQGAAMTDNYGRETKVPETGLVDPAAGGGALPRLPTDANHQPLRRSSGAVTFKSKLNDAYVENAGADHYLTDAFAAGHQIVREVVGRVTQQFVQDKGGKDAFLDLIVKKIQEGAVADPEKAEGELGDFQSASRTWKAKAARGNSWLNKVGVSGLKQKLEQQIHDTELRGIGAKIVHDYYNKRGLIVHNRKGMTFMIKGDNTSAEAPEARRIIAMAVLESRNQITEMAGQGATKNPMDVWDYSPDIDKTQFTETSGPKVMEMMFSNSEYLWHLIKNNFSVSAGGPSGGGQSTSAQDPIQQRIAGRPPPADVGTPPLRGWLERRRAYVKQYVGVEQPPQEYGVPPVTVDGVTLPSRDED